MRAPDARIPNRYRLRHRFRYCTPPVTSPGLDSAAPSQSRCARVAGCVRSLAAALLVAVLGACAPAPLLTELAPGEITVAADGTQADAATIRYAIGTTARLSVYLEDAAGRRYVLRDDVLRPPGSYLLSLEATYAPRNAGLVRRRVLPAGVYTLVMVARDERGASVERRAVVRVVRADTVPPGLRDVTVSPATISPYDPQYPAEATISYALDEPAAVTLSLLWPPGQRTILASSAWREPGQHAERWDGMVGHRWLPEGVYALELAARDRAGNVVAAPATVRLTGTVPPDARITAVRVRPQQLRDGEPLRVEITVRNVGAVTLRTQGPPPGFTYASSETFASIEGGRFASRHNAWRVGIDWDRGPEAESARYPFRWGFGRDLAPGEETTVVGFVRLHEPPGVLHVHAALIREGARYHLSRVGTQAVAIEP